MKTIPCTALVEFTVFVEGFGQVVGAPDSSLAAARKPEVPESALDRFIEGGLVKPPKVWTKAKEDEAAPADDPAPAADTADDQAPV